MAEVENDNFKNIVMTIGGTDEDVARSLEMITLDNILSENENIDLLINSDDYVTKNIMALLMILANNKDVASYNKSYLQNAISNIDKMVADQVNRVINDAKFKEVEKSWLQLNEVANHDYNNVKIAILDVSCEELQEDMERNIFDISSSELFKKIYTSEYDQYGGEPYGLLSSLYEFTNSSDHIKWLTAMGMVAEAAHAPFVATVGEDFFGFSSAEDLKQIKNFETLLEHPRYRAWNDLRKTDQAAYLGLTYGKFILRSPYHPINNPVSDQSMKNFSELTADGDVPTYQWGSSAVLFTKNAIRSYGKTGWLGYIRGPENGGYIEALVAPYVEQDGVMEQRSPVNVTLPDGMELSLSRVGLMPLIHEKGTANACFFSASSIKKTETYTDPLASANSSMVANLSYTLCISRIAQYIKCVLRERIGSVVYPNEIQAQISSWIDQYVTTVAQPSPLEMAKYPFRQVEVNVTNLAGRVGWYKCSVSILPHIQFEGMETTMRIDANLEPSLFLTN